MGHDLQQGGRVFLLCGSVPDRAALHEDDRVLTVATLWSRSQAMNVSGPDALEDRLERNGRQVVAFVDGHLAVVLDQRVDLTLPGKRLHHRDIDEARWFGLATADHADDALADAQE